VGLVFKITTVGEQITNPLIEPEIDNYRLSDFEMVFLLLVPNLNSFIENSNSSCDLDYNYEFAMEELNL
jgi:hypothetical protein